MDAEDVDSRTVDSDNVDSTDVGAEVDFRQSMRQMLGGAVLVVALVAATFWVIGIVGGTDDDLVVADEMGAADPADASADVPDPPAEEPEPVPEPDSEPEPQPEPEPDAEPEPDPEPEPEPDEESPVEAMAPGDVSVQVLDGFQDDGGAAASSVAEALESAGYRIVARSPAIRSDVTAVLWTEGNEEAARQVAEAIGADEVRLQPGTLSESVAVHVVVGADRG